jgi:hypothetical protein
MSRTLKAAIAFIQVILISAAITEKDYSSARLAANLANLAYDIPKNPKEQWKLLAELDGELNHLDWHSAKDRFACYRQEAFILDNREKNM